MSATLEIDQKEFIAAIEKAHLNLINFRSIILVNQQSEAPAWFHFEWSSELLDGTGHTAIEAFRESAKTQYILRAFPLYSLMFPSRARDYIVLIKSTAKLARQKLLEIEAEYMSNPVLKSNMVKINQESGEVFDIDVRTAEGEIINVRIEAYGKGSSIRGLANLDRRPKICIIDDPQDNEDAKSPTTLEGDWKWFLSDVMFLGKYTRIFLIGNNLGEKCIIEQIAAAEKNAEEQNAEGLGFRFFRIPIQVNGKSNWPQMYQDDKINKERDSYRRMGQIDIWMREKMCLAIAPENQVFHREDFQYYTPALAQKMRVNQNAFMMVDPAASKSVDADYRAIDVVGCDHQNNWFVYDVSFGRYDTSVLIDEIFRLVVFWQIREVGIEEGVLKAALEPFIRKEMSKRNVFFNVVPLKYNARKEERIAVLGPRFKAHTIFFPEEAPWLSEMESELLAFTMKGTKGLHDDIIDALAYGEQIIKAPFKSTMMNNNLPRMAEMHASPADVQRSYSSLPREGER